MKVSLAGLHGPFFQLLLASFVVAVKVQQGLLRFESEGSQNVRRELFLVMKFKCATKKLKY